MWSYLICELWGGLHQVHQNCHARRIPNLWLLRDDPFNQVQSLLLRQLLALEEMARGDHSDSNTKPAQTPKQHTTRMPELCAFPGSTLCYRMEVGRSNSAALSLVPNLHPPPPPPFCFSTTDPSLSHALGICERERGRKRENRGGRRLSPVGGSLPSG